MPMLCCSMDDFTVVTEGQRSYFTLCCAVAAPGFPGQQKAHYPAQYCLLDQCFDKVRWDTARSLAGTLHLL